MNLSEGLTQLDEKKLELAKANAIQELYTEALKEQYKAESAAIENAKKLSEAQDILNNLIVDGTTYEWTYQRAGLEQRKAMKNAKEAVENYSSALETSQSTAQTSQQKMQNIATAAGVELPQSFQTAQQSSQGFFDSLLQQTETIHQLMDSDH